MDNIQSLTRALASEDIGLESYLLQTLELIDEKEGSVKALLPEDDRKKRLLDDAKQLVKRFPDPLQRPSLYGILVGVKDLYNVDKLPTRAGSKLPDSIFMGAEAELVKNLKLQGALILGKTVSTEFAYFSPGETRNPVNLEHSPGGSSSGSAAAVAAEYCPLALGTQTIASIIRPASYCGVFGFKPSYGRISLSGVFPFSQSADHIGYICKHFADLDYVAKAVITGWKSLDQCAVPRLGIVRGEFLAQTDEAVKANYYAQLQKLHKAGFELIESDPFPNIDAINTLHRKLIAREFYRNHLPIYSKYHSLYSQASKDLYTFGSSINENDLILLKRNQTILRQVISNLMTEKQIDLWLTPSTTTTAPHGLSSTGSPLMSLPFTHAGLPSISIPSGVDERGLPFGMQIVADFWQDEYLLNASEHVYRGIG